MTVYEKVAASPEELGTLLASLTAIDSPWEEEFHKMFCENCEQNDCDICLHEKEGNNPLWWLTQAAEGEQDARRAVWKNGRVELEPGMIAPLQDEERNGNGVCEEFNVYLNGKGPDGKILRNIKKVILPKISADENGQIEPTDMKLVFAGCEDAAEIINLLGEKCKLEIRAAVRNLNQSGQIEFHGHRYVLEVVPLELKSDPLKRQSGTGLKIRFLVYRYTATVGDTKLWDFEWGKQEWEKKK